MENSPLGRPSAELRNKISAMVLKHDKGVVMRVGQGDCDSELTSRQSDRGGNKHPLGLAHTCRQARAECTEMYYAINEFYLLPDSNTSYDQLCAWHTTFAVGRGLKLGSFNIYAELEDDDDNDDDQAMLTALRENILRIPNLKNDGLVQLDYVVLDYHFMGEEKTMWFEYDDITMSLQYHSQILMKQVLPHIRGTAQENHGSKCLLRAGRIILCLQKALQELFDHDYPRECRNGSTGRIITFEKVQQIKMTRCARSEALIAGLKQIEDTRCTHSGCHERRERRERQAAP